MARVDPLDNPVWSALHSEHANLALGDDTVVWYPDDVGPFGAVEEAGAVPSAEALAYLNERKALFALRPSAIREVLRRQ